MKSPVARFLSNDDGVAAIEFAIILPVMLLLSMGAIELTDALAARRKVTLASSALSDLIAQQRDVDGTYASNALTAVSMIMEPFSSEGLGSVVSSIVVDKDGKAKVAWSLARGKTSLRKGDPYILPNDLKVANSSVVIAQVGYSHSPMIGYALTGTINMSEITYARPRVASQISGVTCSASGC
ncbi:TadE/TadG family type IV pilus assembly protein [Microvirga sp. 2YAF29]|uniref:TadE/TadG family type IV pilus assembly protein n=1 Tax=Microvirga sp. 2YAF29 TaxID=3233031 RepID=UPI003F9B210E